MSLAKGLRNFFLLGLLGSLSIAAPQPARAQVVEIDIIDNDFVPAEIEINTGTTVRWTHKGFIQHTTTSDDGFWDSGLMSNGDSFELTFNTEGVFPYRCLVHPITMLDTITVRLTTGVEDGTNGSLPEGFELFQNYPNPFNPVTTIQFSIANRSHVTLSIFNVLGQRIKTAVDEEKSAGRHSVIWDGTDDNDDPVASGIYFYQITTDRFTESNKMVLLR